MEKTNFAGLTNGTGMLRRRKNKIKRSKGESVVIWAAVVLFSIYAFTLIYPFYYLFINSFKTNFSIRVDPMGLPNVWQYQNYISVWQEYDLIEMFFNSITLSIGQTVFGMAMICVTSYILAKYKFRGNTFIYTFTIIASTVPTLGALPASYKLMSDTGLLDTYIGMIVMTCGGFGGYFLYLHSFFKSVSWTYAESAMIDGASDFRIFWQIMLPMVKNGLIAFTIIQFLGCWNEFWMAYMFYESHPTLAVGLNALQAEATNTGAYAEMFAAMIISVIPILIFYAIFQRKIMSNTIGGGIKE